MLGRECGLRVQKSVQGLGFGVWGLGMRIWGSVARVQTNQSSMKRGKDCMLVSDTLQIHHRDISKREMIPHGSVFSSMPIHISLSHHDPHVPVTNSNPGLQNARIGSDWRLYAKPEGRQSQKSTPLKVTVNLWWLRRIRATSF